MTRYSHDQVRSESNRERHSSPRPVQTVEKRWRVHPETSGRSNDKLLCTNEKIKKGGSEPAILVQLPLSIKRSPPKGLSRCETGTDNRTRRGSMEPRSSLLIGGGRERAPIRRSPRRNSVMLDNAGASDRGAAARKSRHVSLPEQGTSESRKV